MKQYTGHLSTILKRKRISERKLAHKARISRGTLRSIIQGKDSYRINSLQRLMNSLNGSAEIVTHTHDGSVDCSSIAVSLKMAQHSFDSWKIHIMDLVDEFRRSCDTRLILLPPTTNLDLKRTALLSSVVCDLCHEINMDIPAWALRIRFLEEPWFVADSESLKAMAILESPLFYRRNNIFVLENFLNRA